MRRFMRMFLCLFMLATFSCAHDGELVPSMTVRSADTVLPLGAVIAWWSQDDVPEGWLECDGQAIPEGEPLRELMTHTPNYINRFIAYVELEKRAGDNYMNTMGLNTNEIFSHYKLPPFYWFSPYFQRDYNGKDRYFFLNPNRQLRPVYFTSSLDVDINLSLHEYDINRKANYSDYESKNFIQTDTIFENGLYKYKIVIPYYLKKYTEQEKLKLLQKERINVTENSPNLWDIKLPDSIKNKNMLKVKTSVTSTFSSHDRPVTINANNTLSYYGKQPITFQNHYDNKVAPRNVYVRYIIKNF